MLADNRVIESWEMGRPAVAGWMSTNSPFIAQTLAAGMSDAVIIDMQHGSATLADLHALIAGIELRGAEPIVRVPAIDAGLIGQVLDLGATGIIAPLIESAEQARKLVAAATYPPLGERSYGPRMPSLRYGSRYSAIANDEVFVLAMIETSKGMAALDEILATEGLSGIFIGPSDLAMSLGHLPPQKRRPLEVEQAIETIRTSAAAAGAKAGIFCPTAAAGEEAIRSGFDLVTLPPDLSMIQAGAAVAASQIARAIRA